MSRQKSSITSEWIDPDDAPELDDRFFERAEIRVGDTLIKAGSPPIGRPRLDQPKQAVSLRLDADIIAHFKADGEGWQTRINAALRKSLSAKKPSKRQA